MEHFLSGAIAMASLAAGLFFFRFWWKTRDRFFLYFAASFWLEAVNRSCLVLAGEIREEFPVYYAIRLVSYSLILLAIWDKNRLSRSGGDKSGRRED